MMIEEEFFKAFGIEKRYITLEDDYGKYRTRDKMYPKITAEKLLQLICICSTVYPTTINYRETVDELKEFIIGFCIRHSKELGIKQIRKLFEDKNNETLF